MCRRHCRVLLAYTLPVSIVIFKYQSGNWCPSSLILRFIWYLCNHNKWEILACFKVAWNIDHYKDLCTIVAQITALIMPPKLASLVTITCGLVAIMASIITTRAICSLSLALSSLVFPAFNGSTHPILSQFIQFTTKRLSSVLRM